MSATGIIAEFNPLHSGHEYLIKQAKQSGTVVCVLSSNFVQRGDTAILEKRERTLAALNCGVDIVLELPVLWSMSTAQNFALGGVSILKCAGCNSMIFGSETGDINPLYEASRIFSSKQFLEDLNTELSKGVTFAAARQTAAENSGLEKGILKGANNNLGVEYITAAKKLNFNCDFKTVKRIGAAHDSLVEDKFVSASLLREKIKYGDLDFCKKFMPEKSAELIDSNRISDINRLETAILATLRTRSIEDLSRLPDISEGVENKLFSAIRLATSFEELYNIIKVKRYTLARIRRLLLSAFLGFDNSLFMKVPPYIRVLGFNKNGEEFLRCSLSHSPIPVVTKVSDIKKLSPTAQKVFATECRASDLYSLSLSQPLECGMEYTAKLIKTE